MGHKKSWCVLIVLFSFDNTCLLCLKSWSKLFWWLNWGHYLNAKLCLLIRKKNVVFWAQKGWILASKLLRIFRMNDTIPEMSMVDTVEKKNDMRQMSVVVSPSDVDGRQMIKVMEPDPLPGWTLAITAIWKDNWIHDSVYLLLWWWYL